MSPSISATFPVSDSNIAIISGFQTFKLTNIGASKVKPIKSIIKDKSIYITYFFINPTFELLELFIVLLFLLIGFFAAAGGLSDRLALSILKHPI